MKKAEGNRGLRKKPLDLSEERAPREIAALDAPPFTRCCFTDRETRSVFCQHPCSQPFSVRVALQTFVTSHKANPVCSKESRLDGWMPMVMGVAGPELLSDSDMRAFCRAVSVLAQVEDTGTLSGSWLLLVKRGACGGDLLWPRWHTLFQP